MPRSGRAVLVRAPGSVEVRQLAGALATVPEDASALSHIEAPYVLNAVGMAPDPAHAATTRAELGRTVDAMRRWSAGGYLNFVDRPTDSVFDDVTTARLAAVKAEVDPFGLFQVRSGVRSDRSGESAPGAR